MLLRSSSTPFLNSCLPLSKDRDFLLLQRTISFSSFYSTSSIDDLKQKLTETFSDINIQNVIKNKDKAIIPEPHFLDKQEKQECYQEKELEPYFCSIQKLFSSSGSAEQMVDDDGSKGVDSMLILAMGGGEGNDGGKINGSASGGGRGSVGGGHGGGSGFFESNKQWSESIDVYYRKMIEENPGNPLLLGNYAKFLKEIKGDLARAEEYCGRAILEKANDGNVLCLYADLIWLNQKDAHRAKYYFDQALRTAPNDHYIQASYAKFLFESEEVLESE